MSQKFYTLITQQGAALLANATALGIPLKLSKMAVGDANGSATIPDASQTKLVHEVYKAPLNSLTTDEKNPNQIIAELVIPENQGGWFINEIGLYDESDTLVAVGNCPTTYKPLLSEGSCRTQVIRMIFAVDNVNAVTLKIDPSVVLATRQYVDDLITSKMANHEQTTNHPNATTNSKGFVQLNSAIDSNLEDQAATPLAVKQVNERINEITDKFHCDGLESRIYSEDKRFCLLIRNDGSIVGYDVNENKIIWNFQREGFLNAKISVDNIFDLEHFISNKSIPVGTPQPWPCKQPPEGWLECNGSPFDKEQYPKLGAVYHRWLPDLRGEFIRGWDHWKGADPNREILSWQDCMIQKHNHSTLIETSNEQGDGNPWGSGSDRYEEDYIFDTAYTGGHETRPRNVAFMYIVKAE